MIVSFVANEKERSGYGYQQDRNDKAFKMDMQTIQIFGAPRPTRTGDPRIRRSIRTIFLTLDIWSDFSLTISPPSPSKVP